MFMYSRYLLLLGNSTTLLLGFYKQISSSLLLRLPYYGKKPSKSKEFRQKYVDRSTRTSTEFSKIF